jgi:hypothetical protein
MMVNMIVEEEKKSADLTEAEIVAEAQALAYEALIKAQEANRAQVRLKDLRARLSKASSPMSQAAPLREPRRPEIDMALKLRTKLDSVALSPAYQYRNSVEGAASPTVAGAPSVTSLPVKELHASLSKSEAPHSQTLESVALSPADQSRTSVEVAASPTAGGAPSFASLPLKELYASLSQPEATQSQALESVVLSPVDQSRTSAEGSASPTVQSATSLPTPGSILNKSSPGPKAVGFAKRGPSKYAPSEPSFPDPFGGPEGLWGDYDVDNLCGFAPPYEEEYKMHQPNRPEAQIQHHPVQQQQPTKLETTHVPAPTEPDSPKEDSIVAVKAVVAPAVEAVVAPAVKTVVAPADKILAAVGVAVPQEQNFPDPFGGNHGEACGDVDVDRFCGAITYDDEDLTMEQLKQIQMEQMEIQAEEPEKKAEQAPTLTQPNEVPTKLEAPKEKSPVAEKTAVTSPVEAPKEKSLVAEKTAVTSPVKGVAAVGLAVRAEQSFPDPFGGGVDEDAYDVDIDRFCGLVPVEDVPMIPAQPKQIQAQQQQPTSPVAWPPPVASPTAAKPVEEAVTPVVEPTKPVSLKEEPTVAAKASVVSSAETVEAEDRFSYDRLRGDVPDQVQPRTTPVDTDNTVTPTETAEVKPLETAAAPTNSEAPTEESSIAQEASPKATDVAPEGQEKTEGAHTFTDNLCGSLQAEEQNKIPVDTDNTVTPTETAEVKPLETAAAPNNSEASKEESFIAPEASPKAADVASEGQEKTEVVHTCIEGYNLELCGPPSAEEQNRMQEDPKVSPAPKQEEAKPEEQLQLELHEHMIQAMSVTCIDDLQLCGPPDFEEQNKIQEDLKVSPAPKQEEAKPEEQLQVETQEHMIQAKADDYAQSASAAKEENELQEDPKVSPAPKQATPEEQLQLERQEQMIQAKVDDYAQSAACGCNIF